MNRQVNRGSKDTRSFAETGSNVTSAASNVLRYVNTSLLFVPLACANLLRNDKVKSRGLRNLAMERPG
jgi:hypothetical protein